MKKKHKNTFYLFIVTAAWCIFVLFLPVAAQARVFFQDTFETGDYSSWNDAPHVVNGSGEMVTNPCRSGNYAFRSHVEDASGWRSAYLAKQFCRLEDAPDTVHAKLHFTIGDSFTLPQNGQNVIFASLVRTGVGPLAHFYFHRTGDSLYLGTNAGGGATGSTALARNTWHCVELKLDAANETVHAYLNGAQELAVTGLDLNPVNELRAGINTGETGVTGAVVLDDVTIADQPIGFAATEFYLRHGSLSGRLGVKFLTYLAGQSATDEFQLALHGDTGYSNDNEYVKSAPLPATFDFDLDLRTLPQGNYTATLRLVTSGGVVLDEVQKTFEKPYDGIPVSGIDENAAICINGQPRLLIAPYGLHQSLIPTWAQRKYINVLWGQTWNNASLATYRDYLDTADDNGLKAIGPVVDKTWAQQHSSGVCYPNADEIETYITAIVNHPANLMYMWMDEPITNHNSIGGGLDGTIDLVRGWTDTCHRLDPRHLVATSEWATVSGMNSAQRNFMLPDLVADLYSYDYYPIELAWGDRLGNSVTEYTRVAENYNTWNAGLLPFLCWVETADVRPDGSTNDYTQYPPTQEQLRMISWIPIIHGAKGLCWYHYQGETPPANYPVMGEMGQIAESMGTLILGPGPETLVVTDSANAKYARVDTLVRETATDIYIFAVRVTEASGDWLDSSESSALSVTFELSEGPANGVVEDILYPMAAVHEAFETAAAGTEASLTLNAAPVPGTIVLGAGRNSGSSDVGYPTAWDILFDNGLGQLVPVSGTDPSLATVTYATGHIQAKFRNVFDQGEDKIHVGYVPAGRKRALALSGRSFSDTFEPCAVHVYKISKSTAPDNQSPTIPTGLAATAVTANSLTLTWQASEDDFGVSGYTIYRQGPDQQYEQIATATSCRYTNNSLAAATQYTYRVSAYDAAINESEMSDPISATTLEDNGDDDGGGGGGGGGGCFISTCGGR